MAKPRAKKTNKAIISKSILHTIKQHYIFDLDDTLADSGTYNQQQFVEVFSKFLDISDPLVETFLRAVHSKYRGKAMQLQFEEARKHFSLTVTTEELLKINEEMQIQHASKIELFESVKDLIINLSKQHKTITICSNRQYSSLEKIISNVGLKDYVHNTISCSDEGHEKPDPYCINNIINKNQLGKENCIYFGDSQTDKEFAEAAGIDYLIIDQYLNSKNVYKVLLAAFMN